MPSCLLLETIFSSGYSIEGQAQEIIARGCGELPSRVLSWTRNTIS
jgi:hypothetical protein